MQKAREASKKKKAKRTGTERYNFVVEIEAKKGKE